MVKDLPKAFFLDRDGIINKTLIHKKKPIAPRKLSEFKILNKVKESLIFLKKKGFINIIISNQPDIRRGLIKESIIKKINNKIFKELKIDDIIICRHLDIDNCNCRKPKTGLVLRAKKKWNINLNASYLIGDRWRDIELANKLKLKCFFVDNNYNEKKPKKYTFKVKNLLHATKILKKNEKIS